MLTRMIIFGLICLPAIAQTAAGDAVELPSTRTDLMSALSATLERHPGIRIREQQADFNRGVLREVSGQFNTSVSAGAQLNQAETPLTAAQQKQQAQQDNFSIRNITAESSKYTVGGQKLFRNGILVSQSLTLNRTTDNVTATQGIAQSQIGFQIVLPLLRGRGREAVAAQEMSAASSLDASLSDINQTVAQLLTTTAIQYWNAAGASRNLEIAMESEQRGRNYVRDVQTLIDADRVPRAEINQLIANLAGRTASRIQAEQGVITARQNLALAMGLAQAEVNIQPSAADELPDWPDGPVPTITPEAIRQFVDRSYINRADLLAAAARRKAAEQLLPAARNQLRPQLNVNVGLGYNGLMEGPQFYRSFGAPFFNVGSNMYAAVNYSFAPRNDVAQGQLLQAEANIRQSVLTQADVARNIASNVVTAMTTLVNSIAGLRKAREAVASYRVALTDQQEKFRLGLGSLVDVLTIEDRLTSAMTGELSAQITYATALENLRFATGTIINPTARIHTLDRETFLRPPFEWGGK